MTRFSSCGRSGQAWDEFLPKSIAYDQRPLQEDGTCVEQTKAVLSSPMASLCSWDMLVSLPVKRLEA